MKRPILPKLNARGVVHHLALAVVIVGVAIVGTYYLINSFADTCSASSATSSVSGSCTPTSSPTSSPVSATSSTSHLYCTLSGFSAAPAFGSVLHPSVVITNSGTSASPAFTFTTSKLINGVTTSSKVAIASLAAGRAYTVNFDQFIVPYATTTSASKFMGASNTTTGITPFSCSSTINLPAKPASTTPPTAIVAASCQVQTPDVLHRGDTIKPTVTVTNKGNQPISATVSAARLLFGGKQVYSYAPYTYSQKIAPGQTASHRYPAGYTIKKITASQGSITVNVAFSGKQISCSRTFKLQ